MHILNSDTVTVSTVLW